MRLLLLAGGSVLLLAYVVAVIAAGSGVARGTTVLGVEIGGLSTSEAVAKLRSELPARLPARLTLVASEDQATVASDEVGLAVDYEATVAAADGGSLNPFRLIAQLGGAGPVEPVVTANDTAMNTVIESLAAEFTRAPVEGTITFTDGAASAVAPVPGRELDVEQADAVLRQAYAAGRASFDAPVDVTEPQVGQAEVDRAMTELARPAVSGPITLNVADASIEVPVDTFAPYLSMTADSGRLALAVDGAKLHRALDDELDSVELNSKNATFRIVNGEPEVVPSKDGRAVAPADLAAAFVAALPNPTDRRAEAELTVATPSLTTAQAQNLGVVERVSTWTTNVPYAPYRATNIRQAVKYLSGTVVLPGAEFSLNDEVGPRTAERGFVRGIVINGGVLDADWGGGISALATTVFNAVFYGGLEDVEHHPHSYWITRYPKGTEATVSWGAKDLRFVNDSGNGIFITASSTDTTVTITFWGTKKYDISRIEGEEYNVTPYEEIEKDRCFPQPGMRGFDIDVWRVFKQNGDEVKREKFTTHYIPADHVTCKEVITP